MSSDTCFLPALLIWGLGWFLFPWISPDSAATRRLCFYLYCGLQLVYLSWRLFFTLPAPALTLQFAYAMLIVSVECLLTYPAYHFLAGLLATRRRTVEANMNAGWYRRQGQPPMVDILIATYNEAWPIVEKTVVGALRQDYPNVRVWVCDDGRRPWLKEAVEAMGARYLTRDDNRHAKAGNLNAAMLHVRAASPPSDFVAVLDADFIPRLRFVSRSLALMSDASVGLVQTPQYHLNPDPFQTAFNLWDKLADTQRYVFNVVLPARDANDRAYCCGTSFLARTAALEAIGFFPTESITEDVLTSIKMRMNGYRTVYLGELLTTGLAPEGLREFLTQRGRWSLGGVQIGRWLAENAKGLPWYKRLAIVEPFLRWGYSSMARVLFMTVPILFWAFGVIPFVGTTWQVVLFAVPAAVLQRTFMTWISAGAHLPIINQAGALLANFAVIPGMLKGLGRQRQHRFVVTDKGMNHNGTIVHWGALRWLLAYAALLLGLMIYRFFTPGPTLATGPFRSLSAIWSTVNLMIVVVAAVPCVESPRRREECRYPTREDALIADPQGVWRGALRNISTSGLLLASSRRLALGSEVSITLGGLGPCRAVVVRQDGRDPATAEYGLRFVADESYRRELIFRIFCTDDYVHPPETGSGAAVLFAVLRRLFT